MGEAFGISPYEYLHGKFGRLAFDLLIFQMLASARKAEREKLKRGG